MSLKNAIQLGILDVINGLGRPITLPELVEALPINKTKGVHIFRLLRILIHSGLVVKQKISESEEEEGYVITPGSRLLLKDEPLSVTSFLLAMLDPILIEPWHYVSQWFQNEDPTPFETASGRTFWHYAGEEPKLNDFFSAAMANDAGLVTSVVIRDCKHVLEGLSSLVEVGGGTGTVAKAFAEAFPQINCIHFDLLHVVAGLKESKNLSYVGGDMFESIPPANAVLLKWILHDWSDEECVKILKKCKKAIPSKDKGGKVIIIDMMVQNNKVDDEAVETQQFFDMLMMILVTGKKRNEKEWTKLFNDAGFSGGYKITPVLGLRSIIEVYP